MDNAGDREILKALLMKAGIAFEESGASIQVEGGYVGFATLFEFDNKGNLLKIGAYE